MTQRKQNRNTWTKWRRLISEQMQSGERVWRHSAESGSCARRISIGGRNGCGKTRRRDSWEVQVAESPADLPGDSRIEVRLQNGRSLMVGRGFDPEHVRGLLAVVEAAR